MKLSLTTLNYEIGHWTRFMTTSVYIKEECESDREAWGLQRPIYMLKIPIVMVQ